MAIAPEILRAKMVSPPAGPKGMRTGNPAAMTPHPRAAQYSNHDKKSAAGVVAGLRAKGRTVDYRVGPAPSGRSRSDFQATRLPNRGAAPSSSSSSRQSFLGSFFKRFRGG